MGRVLLSYARRSKLSDKSHGCYLLVENENDPSIMDMYSYGYDNVEDMMRHYKIKTDGDLVFSRPTNQTTGIYSMILV